MMIPLEDTLLKLMAQISNSNLYKLFIKQVIKDFELSGQPMIIDEILPPNDLIKEVYVKIHYLLEYNFDGYLRLLYRVDVSENLIKFKVGSIDDIAQKATFHILQREWEKVNLRANFK